MNSSHCSELKALVERKDLPPGGGGWARAPLRVRWGGCKKPDSREAYLRMPQSLHLKETTPLTARGL